MIDMPHGPPLPTIFGFAGAGLAVGSAAIAGATADPSTTSTAVNVGVGGILLGAATLLGVVGRDYMPHFVTIAKAVIANRAENIKNREARHRLANDLNRAMLEIEVLKLDAKEAREKADKSEDLALRVATELEVYKRHAGQEIAVVRKDVDLTQRGVRVNADRLNDIESGSGDRAPGDLAL